MLKKLIILLFFMMLSILLFSANKKYLFSAGNVGFNKEFINKEEVYKITNEWKNIPGFVSIIVRQINADNEYGIQFIYISDKKDFNKINKLIIEIKEKYGEDYIREKDFIYDHKFESIDKIDNIILQKNHFQLFLLWISSISCCSFSYTYKAL